MIDINKLRIMVEKDGKSGIDLEEIHELLDRLEEAESDALEQARLNGMGASREAALMAKLEAAEKERDALRFEIQVREAERKRIEKERDNANVAVAGMVLEAERLRDENEAMKQQESLGTVQWIQGWPVVNAYEGVILEPNKPLYALPGAQNAPSLPNDWPTENMVKAFAEVFSLRDQKNTFGPAFRAALAAAPEAKP